MVIPVKNASSWLCAYTPTDHTTDLVYTSTGSIICVLIDTTQDTIYDHSINTCHVQELAS